MSTREEVLANIDLAIGMLTVMKENPESLVPETDGVPYLITYAKQAADASVKLIELQESGKMTPEEEADLVGTVVSSSVTIGCVMMAYPEAAVMVAGVLDREICRANPGTSNGDSENPVGNMMMDVETISSPTGETPTT